MDTQSFLVDYHYHALNCGFATLDGVEENKKVMKATTAVDENDDNAAFEGFISDENLILF